MRQESGRNLLQELLARIGTSIDEDTSVAIISHLMECGIVTRREALLMRSAMSPQALALPVSAKDVLRAAVLRSLVTQAFRNAQGGGQST